MSDLKITATRNGPYKVEGVDRVLDADGNPLEIRAGKPVWLCRCGQSQNKPFCDSSHRRVDFQPDGPTSPDES